MIVDSWASAPQSRFDFQVTLSQPKVCSRVRYFFFGRLAVKVPLIELLPSLRFISPLTSSAVTELYFHFAFN